MSILIREEFINVDKHAQFGETEPYEPFTDDIGRLFSSLRREYGRASKVYVDLTTGGVRHVGWSFSKRMKYEDARNNSADSYYQREVWVTLYESCDPTDPRACTTTARNGAITRHPFKQLDIDAYRREQRKAA